MLGHLGRGRLGVEARVRVSAPSLGKEAVLSAQGSVVRVHTSSVMAQSDCSMAFSLVERSA